MLDLFIDTNCVRADGALVALNTFKLAFLSTVPVADHPAWSRTRIVAELAARGFKVAVYQSRSAHVFGLAIQPAAISA